MASPLSFLCGAPPFGLRGRTPRLLCCASLPLPPSGRAAVRRLADAPDHRARILQLIDLGQGRSDELLKDARGLRVPGCVAVVRLDVAVQSGVVTQLLGSADAKLPRGILALLQDAVVGLTVEQLMALDPDAMLSAAGLAHSPVAALQTGLGAMLAVIQDAVQPTLTSDSDASSVNAHASATATASPVANPAAATALPSNSENSITPVSWPGTDVAVLLSGGVDSSVALRLVQESGNTPIPFYLRIWLADELAHLGSCPWEDDTEAAEAVCAQAGVKLQTVSMQKQYWDSVVQYTVDEARSGRTPNPDIMCNSRVKFGAFYDAIGNDFQSVATGHYAQTRIDKESGRTQLIASADDWKDQTYFLSHLNQSQLAKAAFPIGHLLKDQVRELAANVFQLPNSNRPDSQGICFLGKLPFDQFLEHYLGTQRGPIVDFDSGIILGEHRGFWYFTLGQRKGIGLSGGPWYVVTKDPMSNTVYVSRNYQAVDKPRDTFQIEALTWILGVDPCPETLNDPELQVKVRHGPNRHRVVTFTPDLTRPNTVSIKIASRDKALAPGQFAAFYLRDVCLGSGVICWPDTPDSPVPAVSTVRTDVRLQSHFTQC